MTDVAAWDFVTGCAWIALGDLAWLQRLANSTPALALDAALSPMRAYDLRGQA
jgi:hypothetical protein